MSPSLISSARVSFAAVGTESGSGNRPVAPFAGRVGGGVTVTGTGVGSELN